VDLGATIECGIALSHWTTVQWRESNGGCPIKLGWYRHSHHRKAWSMTEKIEHEAISRRQAFSLFGLTAAVSLAMPVTLSVLSHAQAQTPGMERREDRREDRQDRREDRREGRQERRDERRTGGDQPATTGGTTGSTTSTTTGTTTGK
jgi:hypothetical protein